MFSPAGSIKCKTSKPNAEWTTRLKKEQVFCCNFTSDQAPPAAAHTYQPTAEPECVLEPDGAYLAFYWTPIHSQGEGQGPAGPSNEPPIPSSKVAEAGRSGSSCKWLHKLISDGCAWTGKAEVTVPVKCVGQVRKLSPFHLNNNNDDSVSPCFCFIQSCVNWAGRWDRADALISVDLTSLSYATAHIWIRSVTPSKLFTAS